MGGRHELRQRLAKKAMRAAVGGPLGLLATMTVMVLVSIGLKHGAAPWQEAPDVRRLSGVDVHTIEGKAVVAEAEPPSAKEHADDFLDTLRGALEKVFEQKTVLEGHVAEALKKAQETSSTGIATMLMGSLTFMMGIFYIVNDHDEDIRRYSWQVISATISIFSAVLLFQAVNGIVEHMTKEVLGVGEVGSLLVGFLHLFVWYCGMQVVLACISGAINMPWTKRRDDAKLNSYKMDVITVALKMRREVVEQLEKDPLEDGSKAWTEFIETEVKALEHAHHHHGGEVCVSPRAVASKEKKGMDFFETQNDTFIDPKNDVAIQYLDEVKRLMSAGGEPDEHALMHAAKKFVVELYLHQADFLSEMVANMACWAVLFGHITGFASIHAWGELQQMIGKTDAAMGFLLVIPAYLCMSAMFLGMDNIRTRVNTGDDDMVDEKEKTWDEVTEETENDVMALMMSFLCTQCLRQWITGALPNAEGAEKQEQSMSHTVKEAVLLIGAGSSLLALFAYRTIKYGSPTKEEEEGEEGEKEVTMKTIIADFFERMQDHIRLTIAMIFAWTLYFGTQWAMYAKLYGKVPEMMLEVLTTLANSAMAFCLIYSFDKIQDSDSTDARVDVVLTKIISALAVLIGFAWEHCFDKATEVLTEQMPFKPSCYPRFVLVCIIGMIVIPAWRWYIVPLTIELNEEAEEKEQEQLKELKLIQKAEEEAKEEVAKWERQGIKCDRNKNEIMDDLLEKYKKENTEVEEKKASLTPTTKLRKMEKEEVAKKVQDLEKKAHTAELNMKRYSHGQKAQIQRVQELERRNKELEDVIYGFQQETDELQKLADRLTGSID
eukprot:TRINITY_DN1027_c0_g2_i1.p1 TRINITY_DN1027_c0_g2~~TRINITY_DN1027_c0_g2_i1.p1  ORF type:complete len:832 (+),score=265.97 TRINITY_DN1027_c0_g2_i1:88-2583(+)